VLSLVEDVLDISAIEAGKLKLNAWSSRLRELVEQHRPDPAAAGAREASRLRSGGRARRAVACAAMPATCARCW
jgi:signal transduction histidine kinase